MQLAAEAVRQARSPVRLRHVSSIPPTGHTRDPAAVVLDAMSQRQIPVGVRAEAAGQEINEHPDRRREVARVRIDGANREVLRDKRVED
jgi:hypothetical protein